MRRDRRVRRCLSNARRCLWPAGLDGSSLKRFLDNPAAPASKVAISQYPRGAGKAGGNVMGYSIRDDRWRLTLWRERNDPIETVNLATNPEHQSVIASLSKHLPPQPSSAGLCSCGVTLSR